ncbi:uncharacterized protein SPSC_00371 [Sporisorium scitamineum]|uniref:Zinc-finger domain-containing protein n=1 Tax=Sporisorium scitamineum TaxID=49012 RepID=A0A0F7SC40_9BASI|nr:uncharacterized protein SPSC_00371 [Sporisorium scitamineum]CDW98760.1 hypothetical protein [Sporisorium scitamineum]
MPLRRNVFSRESSSRSRSHAPTSRRTNGDHSAVASSSSATNGHTDQATLGDLLSSSRTFRTSKANQRIIELLDSSEDEAPLHPTPSQTQQQLPADYDDLDDVVTPELPPADASAPPLPDSLLDSVATPEPTSTQSIVEAESVITSTEVRLSPDHTPGPSSPPDPPPDPLASQRPLFNPEDLEMQPLYDELKALLETEQASDADDDDEDYEQRRLRKLRANDALLAQLGLAGTSGSQNPGTTEATDFENAKDHDADEQLEQTHDAPSRGRGRPKKRGRSDSARPSESAQESRASNKKKKYDRKVKFAEDGTTKSAPLPGETFDLAYIEIPPLRNRARNEYVFIKDVPDIRPEDLVSWSEDEEEEDADADAGEQDELDSDGAIPGYDAIGRIKTRRKRYQPDMLPDGTVLTSCHQCRRKTPGLKMRCSRGSCTLSYCERCITVRYDNMHFDPFATNFTCPRCLGFCNCSICLRRSGYGDLVQKGRKHVLAFSGQLRKLATEAEQDGPDSVKDNIGTLLAQTVALDEDESTPKRRRANRRVIKHERLDPDTPVSGPPKRRGRLPKKREGEQVWKPIKLELDLSDQVAEGEVFSPLEEYVLGRLSVARRVLKLIAAKQQQAAGSTAAPTVDAAPRPRLVVKLRIPPRTLRPIRTFAVADSIVQKKRKVPNYHDWEKDVWVRSAADLSTSESEAGDLTDRDMQEAESEDAQEEDDAQGGVYAGETVFEEGRRQIFAASLLQRHGTTSVASSRESSPLTSLDDASIECFATSSRYNDEASDRSDQAEDSAEEDEVDASSRASFETAAPPSSLGVPQDMQQLALAVLEDAEGATKAVHADILRLHEPLAFPSSSGSEAGQLGALLDAQPAAGTPLLFPESAYSDLDDGVISNLT